MVGGGIVGGEWTSEDDEPRNDWVVGMENL